MESIKISREILEKYINNILDSKDNVDYDEYPIYRNVLIPLCNAKNLNYELVSVTGDALLLLELIENNQLEQKYVDDIIEFSIANL